MAAFFWMSTVACLAVSLIALASALPREQKPAEGGQSGTALSKKRVSSISDLHRPQRRPRISSTSLSKSSKETRTNKDSGGPSEASPGLNESGNQVENESDDDYDDDGVYDLAHFWYNVEDFTYALVEETNSTFLAKLAEVNGKISDMESRLAEKDEQIASLREAVDQLSSGSAEKEPSVGDVRLINKEEGVGHTRGRLLIYAGPQLGWGYVCDDMFYPTSATVACKQLGYSRGVVNLTRPSLLPQFMSTELYTIVLDDVQCSTGDADLLSCSHEPLGVHNCTPLEAVNIICFH